MRSRRGSTATRDGIVDAVDAQHQCTNDSTGGLASQDPIVACCLRRPFSQPVLPGIRPGNTGSRLRTTDQGCARRRRRSGHCTPRNSSEERWPAERRSALALGEEGLGVKALLAVQDSWLWAWAAGPSTWRVDPRLGAAPAAAPAIRAAARSSETSPSSRRAT